MWRIGAQASWKAHETFALTAHALDVRACVCASLDSMEAAAEPNHPQGALRVCLCAGNAQQQSALQENATIRLRRLPGCLALPGPALPPAGYTWPFAWLSLRPLISCYPPLATHLAGGERHVMADGFDG